MLLGIKYEAAIQGGLEGAALARIEEQIRSEAGDDWASHPTIMRGRNAVRAEHGLGPLDAPERAVGPPVPAKLPLWRRLFRGQGG